MDLNQPPPATPLRSGLDQTDPGVLITETAAAGGATADNGIPTATTVGFDVRSHRFVSIIAQCVNAGGSYSLDLWRKYDVGGQASAGANSNTLTLRGWVRDDVFGTQALATATNNGVRVFDVEVLGCDAVHVRVHTFAGGGAARVRGQARTY